MKFFKLLKLLKRINDRQNNKAIRKKLLKSTWVKPTIDLQRLYDCSVQKTAQDFVISTIDLAGNNINVAMDEAIDNSQLSETINNVYQMQAKGQEFIFTYFAQNGFIGFNNCAVLAQDWLIHKAIVAPCEDASAVDYDVTLNQEEEQLENSLDLLAEMKNLTDDRTKYDIPYVCNMFAQNKRKYGQAIAIPIVEGVDYSKPFNLDAVRPNAYKGFSIVEPVWIAPVLDVEALTNPLSKRFYQPTWFRLPDGTMVHHTWCLFNTYGVPSDILKPTYYFGGIPLPQLLYEYVYAAHKTAKEAPMLAQSKRLNYVEGNPKAMLFDPDRENQLNLVSWIRNNFGFLLVKHDQRIGQLDTSLSDFDSVVMLSYQVVAAISGVISTRLLETSPKGWQSGGGYEEKSYKKLQQTIQENDFAPIYEMHYRLLAKSKYNLDLRFVIDFAEIDTPTAKEAAEIREINSRTDSNYINAGVLSPEEVRTVLREDETSGYNALSEEDTDEDNLFNEENGENPDGGQFRGIGKQPEYIN